jgi:hypothetical protein
MSCTDLTPPEFSVGVDAKGRLICQEENLEPSVIKALENYFLCVSSKNCQNFTLAAGAIDTLIPFGAAVDAKVLFVYTQGSIEIKVNSIGSAAIPCGPFVLIMAGNAGLEELYLTNLGTATAVQVFIGA